MLQLAEIQEFVAETREGNALMTTKRGRRYQRGSICKSENGEVGTGNTTLLQALRRNAFNSAELRRSTRSKHGSCWTTLSRY